MVSLRVMIEATREELGIPVRRWDADPPTKQGARWDPVELRRAFESERDALQSGEDNLTEN